MDPWYRVVMPRKEVREGRSFNPDEFAIQLEQVVAGSAPSDYVDPVQFLSRTCFTRALQEHCAMVIRRLSGKTENAAPVLALVTQFGGGKTHTLTTLYHLARNGDRVVKCPGVPELLKEAGVGKLPEAKVAVFVGNAWDPRPGFETPWIDLARQLAGDRGVEELGASAESVPPGTEALRRLFAAANAPVLILCDEVLNFFGRHRKMAESFYAFMDNLVRAMTGAQSAAAMISLPRSQIEMTEWDQQWQEKIQKVVRRVAKDLIVNDEAEVSEVVRRRLFDDIGTEKIRKNTARAFAEWCFNRRERLPREWMAVDAAATEAKAKAVLEQRFAACYPFHPGTLSVFQRKWQALPQYQQTRGTLAMLAQWISIATQNAYREARTEPLITLGSAPLDDPNFRSVVLGQLGEARLIAALDWDISGTHSHARALDADARGALRDIHRRVGTTILFESSGGQADRVAHLAELRFDLGEPQLETTSIDNAAIALQTRSYYVKRAGSDGFRVGHKPTVRKVMNDKRANLDDETEVRPQVRKLVSEEFQRGASVKIELFPNDGGEVPDSPRLTLIVVDPETGWDEVSAIRDQIADWTVLRNGSPRLYPASLVWCVKKPGRDLRDKVEIQMAWKRVSKDVADGTLVGEFDKNDKAELQTDLETSESEARDQVWADYRYAIVMDASKKDGLDVIDLGAGHSSGKETLCGRVVSALTQRGLLSESVSVGYLERNWPKVFAESGAWPLASLRQSLLNGALTRLMDPDSVLKEKIPEFVQRGEFGLASGRLLDGRYQRVWYREALAREEVQFEDDVFLISKKVAEESKALLNPPKIDGPVIEPPEPPSPWEPGGDVEPEPADVLRTLRVVGTIPPEVWNRLGTRILPKLRSGIELSLGLDFAVSVPQSSAQHLLADLKQALEELGLSEVLRLE